MALALMGAWIRSLVLSDAIVVPSGTRWVDAAVSDAGYLMWVDFCDENPSPSIQWKQFSAGFFRNPELIEWRRPLLVFESGEFRASTKTAGRIWSAHFGAIVLPLTLISAYLLVVPSRKRP